MAIGRHSFEPDPDEPSQYAQAFTPARLVCKVCKGETRMHKGAVTYCPMCDKLQDMTGQLPGREYGTKGSA